MRSGHLRNGCLGIYSECGKVGAGASVDWHEYLSDVGSVVRLMWFCGWAWTTEFKQIVGYIPITHSHHAKKYKRC